jgi:hypothetical protein
MPPPLWLPRSLLERHLLGVAGGHLIAEVERDLDVACVDALLVRDPEDTPALLEDEEGVVVAGLLHDRRGLDDRRALHHRLGVEARELVLAELIFGRLRLVLGRAA